MVSFSPAFFAFQINKQKTKRIRSPTAIRSDGIYLPLTELSNLKFDFNFTTLNAKDFYEVMFNNIQKRSIILYAGGRNVL